MKGLNYMIAIALISFFPLTVFSQSTSEYAIYNGKELTKGYGIGVDSSEHLSDWLEDSGNELVMTYPDKQQWGAVFITVGPSKKQPKDRKSKNFSNFDTLLITMKGSRQGEEVYIGIKDRKDPDDGSEKKMRVKLGTEYTEYIFSLSEFTTADLQNLYVVTEFVFPENSPCRVFVKTVKFR